MSAQAEPEVSAPKLDGELDRHGRHVRVWCIYCLSWHTHAPESGHRAAHCWVGNSPYLDTGYYIEVPEALPDPEEDGGPVILEESSVSEGLMLRAGGAFPAPDRRPGVITAMVCLGREGVQEVMRTLASADWEGLEVVIDLAALAENWKAIGCDAAELETIEATAAALRSCALELLCWARGVDDAGSDG